MSCDNVTIVTRQEWGARDSKTINNMTTPVSFVFIHHTAMSYCHNQHDCSQELRTIQDFHMDTRGTYTIITLIYPQQSLESVIFQNTVYLYFLQQ